MSITELNCPDCEGPMHTWTDGDHPDEGMIPRAKCKACGRWIFTDYFRTRFNTKEEAV